MVELLAPAGDPEKLRFAADFGADAVYFGGKDFSLRSGAGNFTVPEIKEGMDYLHERGKKGYMALNIYARDEDLEPFREYLRAVKDIDIDAFIVSDPGLITLIREEMPEAALHLSTQANTTNRLSARFWMKQGVSRIIAARELSFDEIKELSREAETEVFVHGAMCISYSGRCLLSDFMADRDANRGMCAHPCRWRYALTEEKRPGEYYPLEEDERGTYIMNSRDLCMIEHIPDLMKAGITSFKIEGRMKSVFYITNVVRAYRAAIDSYLDDPLRYRFREEWMDMLTMASHREFSTGFFYNMPADARDCQSGAYTRNYTFTGIVRSRDRASGTALIEQRNRMRRGDEIEVYGPDMTGRSFVIGDMRDEEGIPIDCCPHPRMKVRMSIPFEVKPGYILCLRNDPR